MYQSSPTSRIKPKTTDPALIVSHESRLYRGSDWYMVGANRNVMATRICYFLRNECVNHVKHFYENRQGVRHKYRRLLNNMLQQNAGGKRSCT